MDCDPQNGGVFGTMKKGLRNVGDDIGMDPPGFQLGRGHAWPAHVEVLERIGMFRQRPEMLPAGQYT